MSQAACNVSTQRPKRIGMGHLWTWTFLWGVDLSGSPQGTGGVRALLSLVDAGGSTRHYPSYDGNGNIVAWTNSSRDVLRRFDFDPFGNVTTTEVAATAMPDIPLGFSTKYTDAETGLLYYGRRYYIPPWARWASPDPIEEKGGLNLYGFVGNCSVCNTDSLGLDHFVFTGSPIRQPDKDHDHNWANYYNASWARIIEIARTLKEGEEIVWAIEKSGYIDRRVYEGGIDYVAVIEKGVSNYRFYAEVPIRLVWVTNRSELANAFNNNPLTGLPRDKEPNPLRRYSSFTYYGHGAAGKLLPYPTIPPLNPTGNEWSFPSARIGELLLKGAITKQCRCVSYACNSATPTGEDGKSFADAWQDFFGVVLYSIKGKSDYSPAASSRNPFHQTKQPVPSTAAGAEWQPSPPP